MHMSFLCIQDSTNSNPLHRCSGTRPPALPQTTV